MALAGLAFVILFQPELRRLLVFVGQSRLIRKIVKVGDLQFIEEIIQAVMELSRKNFGALIVIERDMSLKSFIETGLALQAKVSKQLISSVFNPREATVIFEGNRIRLRLSGLKLAAYERTPSSKNRKLLKKLKETINSTDKIKKVIIEVYSDSWGGDALNKKLSVIRASTIKNYLIRIGVNRSLLKAKGIGNKNPIASNKTFEGRNKNRRVEVVFIF